MKNKLLSTVTLLLLPAVSLQASDFPLHTHTNTPIELKSISPVFDSFRIANVCFMGYGDCDSSIRFNKDGDYNIDTAQQCLNEGFTKQNCNSVQQIEGVCPYDPAYGLRCVCKTNLVTCPAGQVGVGISCGGKYVYCQCDSKLVACAANQNGSGAYCGGKFQSCVCKDEYRYTSSNCPSPQSLSGSSCGGKYTGCSCPSGVNPGSYGCASYYPYPCHSVCRAANSDNCQNRTSVSAPYGCMTYWPDCPSKCQTAYKDNCRSRNGVSCTLGCASYWGDCSSKCQTCQTDNCQNRTAAATPHGCAVKWSDCLSKCQIAFGPACKIGDIYYSDGTCINPAYHTTAKTALGVVIYITDNGNHGQIIAPRSVGGYKWDTKSWQNSFSTQTVYQTKDAANQDFASCQNTNNITSYVNNTFPAAWAARNYFPTSQTQNKWCLPAAGVLNSLAKNKTVIFNAIAKIGGTTSDISESLWSSTEIVCGGSTNYYAATNNALGIGCSAKGNILNVRPVLEF